MCRSRARRERRGGEVQSEVPFARAPCVTGRGGTLCCVVRALVVRDGAGRDSLRCRSRARRERRGEEELRCRSHARRERRGGEGHYDVSFCDRVRREIATLRALAWWTDLVVIALAVWHEHVVRVARAGQHEEDDRLVRLARRRRCLAAERQRRRRRVRLREIEHARRLAPEPRVHPAASLLAARRGSF